jgi:hypothetical protein
MGLSWQHGPLGRTPNGQFLAPAMPERVPYAEPLRRRLRAELGGRTVVQSEGAHSLLRRLRLSAESLAAAAAGTVPASCAAR